MLKMLHVQHHRVFSGVVAGVIGLALEEQSLDPGF
jgi:hypothetical protein